MSIVCQNVATLTTTIVRTIVTVFVSTVLSQDVGTRTALVSVSASQVQVPVTFTSQFYQTQFNTLIGTSCRTIPVAQRPSQPPSPQPPAQPLAQPTTQPTTQPTAQRTTRPTTQPTTQPTTPPAPGITDTTYTTEYVTVTGSDPLGTTTTSISTSRPTGTSPISRTTVYSGTGDPTSESAFSNTGIAAPSPTSSSVPVEAIVGGVVGGVALIVLLGVLAYFLIFRKSVFAPKGYERPVGAGVNDQSVLYPQMQGPARYQPYHDGQYQGSTSTSLSPQYSDFPQPQTQTQGLNGHNFYTNDSQGTQVWQQNMASAVAALPAGAAAAVVIGHSRHRSDSSPGSYTSTTPLLVPYRGYAEPAEEL